ncbi:glutathione S-transferase family protein [Glaciimonas sp. CA11.2]|uniref:glutathione S-transferase family protein n=1 Tax=Glaciimonas sp. CA11.2 TaxID=3048601 RepID=UPI002AB4C711|nr:glutathione S-transferase family protein [Glaciimonas sp. CA11.2]MDY7545240.1 glutathione S-transferase family protein [Glaciimonas sp. CA11.2]MEB0161623.1 glutathione S-transferase family protein [Glaciimonas sp. CA11.2]
MADLILHHFLISPFSEKIRLALGYKKLAWKSVIVPGVMPKPDVVALTGGYRKTPFLQIGADIYCDSALICEVLEQVQPSPALYPSHGNGVARTLAQWADTTLFWSVLAPPRNTAHMFAGAPPDTASLFSLDRETMKGPMLRLRGPDAAAACKDYLERVSDMLSGQPYLLGQAPCIADFSVYHSLWFSRQFTPVVEEMLRSVPAILSWMERMQAFGHGQIQQIDSSDAVAIAANAEPLPIGQGRSHLPDNFFQDEHGIPLGSRVSITAESFGPEATEGELVAATRSHFTLRRHDVRAGFVHVHFPRIGYVLNRVTSLT